MKIESFNERVDRHLVRESVVPPIVGQFSRLLVAAAIVRGGSHQREGYMLLANIEKLDERRPGNGKCLKLSGYFAPAYSSDNSGAWGVSATTTIGDFLSFIALEDTRNLLNGPWVDTSNTGEVLVTLSLVDPGAGSTLEPSLNGKPFDVWKRLSVPVNPGRS
jgi:hypothetical protein